MALYAIGDLHLSLGADKPMDIFPGWEGYLPKLETHWRRLIAPEDTVIVPGDISWALTLPEARKDLAFIDRLPGKKILMKGNHDFWWSSMKKLESFCEENGFSTLSFLYHNACRVEGKIVAGTRGWLWAEKNRSCLPCWWTGGKQG